MRHLYLRIYLLLVLSLVTAVMAAGAFWRTLGVGSPPGQAARFIEALAAEALPGPEASLAAQQTALERLVAGVPGRASLYAADRTPIASVGEPLPSPEAERTDSGWLHAGSGRPAWALALPDGRWLVLQSAAERRHPAVGLMLFLGLIGISVAVAAYPATRLITRRLERLQSGVEALGSGDLAARVTIAGRDEVAALAASFNLAAARIETLVGAQRRLLANASHELRSPLTRIRMALQLQGSNSRPEVRAEIERDITELDQLIEEILLASRLDARGQPDRFEPLDLTGIVAEECARGEAHLDADAVTVDGDPRLLRRLVRNLVDNARRHGGTSPIEVTLRARNHGGAKLRVCDRGPGVPADERERIFEPFYRLRGTSERAGGTGLGLALVRQIAERHGGTAACEERTGGGACFTVRLG